MKPDFAIEPERILDLIENVLADQEIDIEKKNFRGAEIAIGELLSVENQLFATKLIAAIMKESLKNL